MSPSLQCPAGAISYQPAGKGTASSEANNQSKCTLLQAGLKCKHKATYASLIAMAIYSSPNKRLMLHQIYAFVDAHRLLVPAAVHPNWKNSVRHNLSLRPCFRKVPRWALDGKKLSAYWELDMVALPPAAAAAVAELNTHGLMQFPFDKYVSEDCSDNGEDDADDEGAGSAAGPGGSAKWVGSNPRSAQQSHTSPSHMAGAQRWTTPEISEEDTDDESHATAAAQAAARHHQQHMAWIYGRQQFLQPPHHAAAIQHSYQQHLHLMRQQQAMNAFYYGHQPPAMHPMYPGVPQNYPSVSSAHMLHRPNMVPRPGAIHPSMHATHYPVHSAFVHPVGRSASEPVGGPAENDVYTPPRSPAMHRSSVDQDISIKVPKLKKRPSPKPSRVRVQNSDDTDDDDDAVIVVRPKSTKRRAIKTIGNHTAGKSEVKRSKSGEDSTDSLLGILAHAATIVDSN